MLYPPHLAILRKFRERERNRKKASSITASPEEAFPDKRANTFIPDAVAKERVVSERTQDRNGQGGGMGTPERLVSSGVQIAFAARQGLRDAVARAVMSWASSQQRVMVKALRLINPSTRQKLSPTMPKGLKE